jgi:hypothetical protein
MLSEIFMLRLEADLRAAAERVVHNAPPPPARFVVAPVKVIERKPS